jgi:hypothetical protein
VPTEVDAVLRSDPRFSEPVLVEALAEHRTASDTFPGEPRNADLAILGRDQFGSFVVCIEAKADEAFGDRVDATMRAAVKRIAREEPSNAITRAQQLREALLPPWREGRARFGDLRYQLLTGTAGTLAFAREQGASRAVFLVYELVSPSHTTEARLVQNSQDFDAFLSRISDGTFTQLEQGRMFGPVRVPGNGLIPGNVDLFFGKARRPVPF